MNVTSTPVDPLPPRTFTITLSEEEARLLATVLWGIRGDDLKQIAEAHVVDKGTPEDAHKLADALGANLPVGIRSQLRDGGRPALSLTGRLLQREKD